MIEKVETLLMAVAYIGLFNCLVRCDYNVVIGLICYFYWNTRAAKTRQVATVIAVILAVSLVFDVIWMMIIWKSWTGSNWASPVWNNLRSWHVFVIFLSFVNLFLKAAAAYFVWTEGTQGTNPNVYRELRDNVPFAR